MKQKLILTLLIILSFSGCKEQEDHLELSQSIFALNNESTTLTIDLRCNTTWKMLGDDVEWCSVEKKHGVGDSKLILTIQANETEYERKTKIFIESGINYKVIEVKQISKNANMPYSIPVVFHVLYYDKLNTTQYVNKGWLAEILTKCNAHYKAKLDMGIEFVAAKTDPSGVALEEPGVNRIQVNNAVIDPNRFMNYGNKEGNEMLWDLNKYINVFVYTFSNSITSNEEIIGISHLPYATVANPLSGLKPGDSYLGKTKPTDYTHCLSLNNKYIYKVTTSTKYEPGDISVTLSHELGHYLGLFHAFSTSTSKTDYCNDTPDYNRENYIKFIANLSPYSSLETLAKRTSVEGVNFTSTNIMDYYYSFSNEFTEEQRKRTRHVLNYSPMIPGPKLNEPSKSTNNEPIPEMRYIE